MRNMWEIFYRHNISRKIAIIFLTLLAMMGVGGMVGLYNAIQINNVARQLYSDFFAQQDILSAVEREMISVNQGAYLYVISSDIIPREYIGRSEIEGSQKVKMMLEEYKMKRAGEKETFLPFDAAWSEYMTVVKQVMEISDRGGADEALNLLKGAGTKRFKYAIEVLNGLISHEKSLAFDAYQKADAFSVSITRMTISLTVLAIFVSVGLWILLSRSITKPIRTLEESARRIAAGNLEERASVVSKDEIGELATEFNKMAEYLEDFYATLEKKVEERTEAIRAANEELLRNKQEMEMLNEELVKANRMKSQFLATVSHELRTPLNSIMGFSELLTERSFGELNEKQSQYINYIHASGNHLLNLINNILDLSKIEAGKLELNIEEFPIADSLSEVLATIRPIAHKKGVTINCKDTPVSPLIKMDRQKFKQIMLNLLSNAIKFNKDRGGIDVDWDIKEELKGGMTEKALYFSVRDTGIGIKQADIPRIFKEFEQLDPSITREYGGTGLGLALTKKLVEMHDGRIWMDSEYGKGSVFSFIIPQGAEKHLIEMKEAVSAPSSMLIQDSFEQFAPTILVASETASLNELIKIYLEQNGYIVELASDGAEVLEKANALKPFAIIVGVSLPRKDGWEVIKELKSSHETADIPVIIVSSADNKELGFSLGAVDYMVKPIDKEKLVSVLTKLTFTSKVKKHPFSILAIDDEPQVLELIGDILEKEGFGVIKATDGEEGVKLAIERDPDLIILDLMMPRVSGFDVVDQLKKHPIAKDIPILVFTAKDINVADKVKLGDNIANILIKANFSKNGLLSEIKKLEMAFPARARMLDPLTRAFNFKYFTYWIVKEIARSKRYGVPFSMMMVDVDDLLNYNMKHGFILGNKVLVDITRLIEDNTRKADSLIRYKGDEFIVVLPNTTRDVAGNVAEKVRMRVENHVFPSSDVEQGSKMTISIGVATFPADGKTSEQLLANLINVTKIAFRKGGNRVILFKGDL